MEGLALQRAWLDDEEGSIRFQHTKSGAQTRIIGRSAAELLLAQPNTGSPFFFPADWGDGHFIGVVRVFDRVCAMAQLTAGPGGLALARLRAGGARRRRPFPTA